MKLIFVLSMFFYCPHLLQQPAVSYRNLLQKLNDEHQQCLDEGKSMMLCSRDYSYQMDSVLNLVYKELITQYTKGPQEKLRQEQRQWIKDRDKEFKIIWADVKKKNEGSSFIGQDDRMFAYEKEAEFIELRIQKLIAELDRIKH